MVSSYARVLVIGENNPPEATGVAPYLMSTKWSESDAIVDVSPALIASAMVALKAKMVRRDVPFVVWMQDLCAVGLTDTRRAPGATVCVMKMIEGWLLHSADRVIVIRDRFADDFGMPRERIEVVRSWTRLAPAPARDIAATRAEFGWRDDETVVLHAGTMGAKQGLPNVIDAARLAPGRVDPVRFVLLGAGSELARLKAASRGIRTRQFLAPLHDSDFAATLGSADCLLANEPPGVSEMAVPNELTSCFSAGKPIVAATDLTGITAEEIRTAAAGVLVAAGDPGDAARCRRVAGCRSRRLAAPRRPRRPLQSPRAQQGVSDQRFHRSIFRLIAHDNRVAESATNTPSP